MAICNVIDRYNALAPLQTPPHPILVYLEVVDYCNFSKFEILKHSDHNILTKDWANLTNRQAANKYFKILRAEEEIRRCNIEVARVQVWVDVEDAEMARAVAARKSSDPAFAAHLRVIQTHRRGINDRLRARLLQIYSLPGYSGPHPPVAASSIPPVPAGDCKFSVHIPPLGDSRLIYRLYRRLF